jgi:hypothetical protein
MRSKFQWVDYIIIFTIAAILLRVVANKLPYGLGNPTFLWGPLAVLSIIATRPKVLQYGPLQFLILYGIVYLGILQFLLWQYLSDWDRGMFISEFVSIIIATTIYAYYRQGKEYEKLARISIWVLGFIIITLITTNIALFYNPWIVYESAAARDASEQEYLRKLYGFAGYGYSQAFVLLIPVLFYHVRTRKKLYFNIPLLAGILSLLIVTIARSQVFANLLVGGVILAVSFLGFKRRRTTLISLALAGLLVVFAPPDIHTQLVLGLRQNFEPGTDIYGKLTDFAIITQSRTIEAGTSFDHRADRYPMLFDALLENPVTGYASHSSTIPISAGGHLWWMYRLALWGIPGFLFFVYVFYKIFASIGTLFVTDELRYYYLLGLVSFILLGLTKNVSGAEPFIMLIVVIPGLYLYSVLNEKTEPNRKL